MRDYNRFRSGTSVNPDIPRSVPLPERIGGLPVAGEHFTVVRDLGEIAWLGERAYRTEMMLNRAAQFGEKIAVAKRHITLVPGTDVYSLNQAITRQRPYEQVDDVLKAAVAGFTPNKFIELGSAGILSNRSNDNIRQWFVVLLLSAKSEKAINKETRQILGKFGLESQQDLTPHITVYKTEKESVAEKVMHGVNRIINPDSTNSVTGTARLSRPYSKKYRLNRARRGSKVRR